jgi:hypothetical protein
MIDLKIKGLEVKAEEGWTILETPNFMDSKYRHSVTTKV